MALPTTDNRRMVRPGITFRVFVSSTFRDFTMERNALQEKVWPRLRDLCMRHGARFQAIDLRWGVSEEAGQDQRAMEICLEEIRRCQEVTPRPNFIVLLGDRYGWRPLPATIPQDEFEAILEATPDPDDCVLIDEWYAVDENAIPAEYCLLGRGELTYGEWGPIERRLHSVLLDGARAAGLAEAAMVKFERSATEQEIIAGALEARKGNAFGYIRTIEGMPEDARAGDFIDLANGVRDPEARRLIDGLKGRLAEHLPQEYQHEIEARWDGSGLSGEHIDAFCEKVYEDLERAILEETEKLGAVDELDQEIQAHAEFGRQRRQHFIGREEIIEQAVDYGETAVGPRALTGHGAPVWAVAVTPDGRRAVSASPDEALKVWDLESGAELRTLTGNTRWVNAVAVTPDGRRAVSASRKTLKLWNLENGAGLRTLRGHRNAVLAVAVTADGRRAVSGAGDYSEGELKVWDLESGAELYTLSGHRGAVNALAVTADGHRAVSGSEDRTLKVWDLESGEGLRTLTGHRDGVVAVAVTADGRRAVSGAGDYSEGELKVWDLESGAELYTLTGHRGAVNALAVTADGRCAISGCDDGTLKVWDVERGGAYPLVIHGRSGSGKSALMAKIAADLEDRDATVITRYIGATPASTQVHLLLQSLCEQIYRDFGFETLEQEWQEEQRAQEREHPEPSADTGEPLQNPYRTPADPQELPRAFERFLGFVPDDRELVLVLDALDQLSPENNAHSLAWLPWQLPGNVRLIISVLEREDEAGHCHQAAAGRLLRHPEALLALEEMSMDECEAALDEWLEHAGGPGGASDMCRSRMLTAGQRADVIDGLRACPEGHALFLRLAFEEARRWRSFDPLPLGADDEPGLSDTVPGVIADMLSRLEHPANHGRTLVERALGYLHAARHGLAEDEILQVLSADGEVMADFAQRSPTERDKCVAEQLKTLPPVVWSRLYFDLRPYLAERAADGTSLLNFYHRQVGEAVGARFLGDETIRVRSHQKLGEYFGGAVPDVAQPNWVDEGARLPNHRRMSELPWQLTAARDWDTLTGVLTEYGFLDAKLHGAGVQSLIEDYERACAAEPGLPVNVAHSLTLIGDTLRLSSHVLAQEPDQLPSQLFGRLMGLGDDGIQALLSSAESSVRRPWLRPVTASLVGPGGPLLRTLVIQHTHINAIAVTADGRQVTCASGSVDDTPGELNVWDLDTGTKLHTLVGHHGDVNAVAMTPDGRRAVSGGGTADAMLGELRVWDLETGTEVLAVTGQGGPVSAVAVAADGRRAISAATDQTVKVWDLDTGALVRTLTGHVSTIHAVAVTPDGSRAVSGGGDWLKPYELRVWDLRTGAEVLAVTGQGGPVCAVAVTADGCRVAAGCGVYEEPGEIRVWDVESGRELRTLTGHEGGVLAMAMASDGRRAVSASVCPAYALKVWDLEQGVALRTLTGHSWEGAAVAITPDGCRAVSAASDQTLKVWDLGPEAGVTTVTERRSRVHSVAVTADGRRAVSGSSDGTLRVWDMGSGAELRTLTGHTHWVSAVAVTPTCGPNGAAWAVSASMDHTLKLWDLESGETLRTLTGHASAVTAVAVTPDGRRAVSGAGNGYRGELIVWDLESGAQLRTLTGHSSSINSVAVTADGRRAVSAGAGPQRRPGELAVWDLESGTQLRTLTGHSLSINAVAVTADGCLAISASYDNTLKVWHLETAEVICSLRADNGLLACAVGGDGTSIVAIDDLGGEHFLHLENTTPGALFCTAWRVRTSPQLQLWQDGPQEPFAFGCLHCRVWSQVSEADLGTKLPCPNCGKPVKLNEFTIEADWRPVAAAWKPEAP